MTTIFANMPRFGGEVTLTQCREHTEEGDGLNIQRYSQSPNLTVGNFGRRSELKEQILPESSTKASVNKLLNDPLQFLSPYVSNKEEAETENWPGKYNPRAVHCDFNVKQLSNENITKLSYDENAVFSGPMESCLANDQHYNDDCIQYNLSSNLSLIWGEKSQKTSHDLTQTKVTENKNDVGKLDSSCIPHQYSSKKDFENYLKQQQINLAGVRNKSFHHRISGSEKSSCPEPKIPPRVLHETRCKSMEELEQIIRKMTPREREAFVNKFQLTPGVLDYVPYSPPLDQSSACHRSDAYTECQSNETSEHNWSTQNRGLLDFPLFGQHKMGMQGKLHSQEDEIRTTSATDAPNLASLMYSQLSMNSSNNLLPYLQTILMLQTQQNAINASMASLNSSSVVDLSSNPLYNQLTVDGILSNLQANDSSNLGDSFSQNANVILRSLNSNYTLFNELMNQQRLAQTTGPSDDMSQSGAEQGAKYNAKFEDVKNPLIGGFPMSHESLQQLQSPQNIPQAQLDLYANYLSVLNGSSYAFGKCQESAQSSNTVFDKALSNSSRDCCPSTMNYFGSASHAPKSYGGKTSNIGTGSRGAGKHRSNMDPTLGGAMTSTSQQNGGQAYQHVYAAGGGNHAHQQHSGRSKANDILLSSVSLAVEQFKAIENERKKTEVTLLHLFPDHDMRSDNGRGAGQSPRMPPNPTKVDRLVGEMQKEHPKPAEFRGRY